MSLYFLNRRPLDRVVQRHPQACPERLPWQAVEGGTTTTTNGTTDAALADTSTAYTYSWWDGAMAATTTFDNDTGNGSNTPWVSTYNYDGRGHLASVHIADGRTRDVSYVTDNYGQVLQRDGVASDGRKLFNHRPVVLC